MFYDKYKIVWQVFRVCSCLRMAGVAGAGAGQTQWTASRDVC